MHRSQFGVLAALIAAFFMGLANPFGKLAADAVDPLVLATFVTLIASGALAVLLLIQGVRTDKLKQLKFRTFFDLGILGHGIPVILVLVALKATTAMNVLFLSRTEIFFATILGVLLLKERISRNQLIGIFVGFVGVFIFATELKITSFNIFDLMAVLAGFFWAHYDVVVRRVGEKISSLEIVAIRNISALPLLIILLIFSNKELAIPQTSYLDAAIFGLSMFVVGVFAYNAAIKRIGVWKAAVPTHLLSVVFGAVFTFLILGETLSDMELIGAAAIILGTFLALKKENGT